VALAGGTSCAPWFTQPVFDGGSGNSASPMNFRGPHEGEVSAVRHAADRFLPAHGVRHGKPETEIV